MKISEINIDSDVLFSLTLLACDTKVVNEIGNQLNYDIWEDEWDRLLAQLIVNHIQNYNVPVIDKLSKLVKDKAETLLSDEMLDGVYKLAKHVEKAYKGSESLYNNHKYNIDKFLKWVKMRNLEVLSSNLEKAIDKGDIQAAERYVNSYSDVKQVEMTDINILQDSSNIEDAYAYDEEELLTLHGALGQLIGPLKRSDYFLTMGESGIGKSWITLQFGQEALKKGYSVLYLNLEISQKSMLRRIYSYLSVKPKKSKKVSTSRFVAISDDESDDPEVTTQKYEVELNNEYYEGVDTSRETINKVLSLKRMTSNGGVFRLLTMPSGTLSIRGLETELENLRVHKKFIPDVMIVDYPELMISTNTRLEKRFQIGEIHAGLRKIAQVYNMLVIAPYQSNRDGFNKTLGKKNTSESIEPLKHASVMIGVSRSVYEKNHNLVSVNMIKARDEREYTDSVLCTSCLDLGRMFIDSKWKRDVIIQKKGSNDDE